MNVQQSGIPQPDLTPQLRADLERALQLPLPQSWVELCPASALGKIVTGVPILLAEFDRLQADVKRLRAEKENLRQRNELLRRRLDCDPNEVKAPRLAILATNDHLTRELAEVKREVEGLREAAEPLAAWLAEGDAPGEPWSGAEWCFTTWGATPAIQPGERVYVVCEGRLVGYAPLTELIVFGREIHLVREGGAVACTIPTPITGFRGWRYRWWSREEEMPLELSASRRPT